MLQSVLVDEVQTDIVCEERNYFKTQIELRTYRLRILILEIQWKLPKPGTQSPNRRTIDVAEEYVIQLQHVLNNEFHISIGHTLTLNIQLSVMTVSILLYCP